VFRFPFQHSRQGNPSYRYQLDGRSFDYTYDGDGLRRSAQEPSGSVSTMIWDGSDYLGEL
jgi:hypothetical protein